MKKMLVLAMTMAMVLLAAAGVCETLRVGLPLYFLFQLLPEEPY